MRHYHTYNMCYDKYKRKCLQHIPGHIFGKRKKNLSFSLVLYLLYPSTPPPYLSLYRCGYLISTIDTKFLFLITIVLCCAN